jgi:hypothetical protein
MTKSILLYKNTFLASKIIKNPEILLEKVKFFYSSQGIKSKATEKNECNIGVPICQKNNYQALLIRKI